VDATARRTRSELADAALIDGRSVLSSPAIARVKSTLLTRPTTVCRSTRTTSGEASPRSAQLRRVVTALPARGEVWWCELAEIGRGPVVVLSRDAAISRLRRTPIGPCTTTIRGIPSAVILEPGEDPVPPTSVVNLDSVESVLLGTLVERLGRLSDERMRQICEALEIAVAFEA